MGFRPGNRTVAMKFWSIEGNSQRLDGGAMFGNVPRALWSRWMEADEYHRIPLACRGLLVEDLNGKTVLFETGIGAFFDPKLKDRFGVMESGHVLLDNLRAVGFEHEDIDAVVLSHLHFDHAGGLLSEYVEGQDSHLLFPNAQYIVGEQHWQRAKNPHPRDRASFVPHLLKLLEESGRLELVSGHSSKTLGKDVRFVISNGHTPGLMLAELADIVFCADLIPGRPWVHVPVTMGYDRYPELLIDEKKEFLEDKLNRNIRLFFTHDHGCALASISRDEKGRYITVDELQSLQGLSV